MPNGTDDLAAGRLHRFGARRFWTRAAIVAAAAAVCYFFADLPVARLVAGDRRELPTYVQSFLDAARYYGQGFWLVFAFGLILAADPGRWAKARLFFLAVATTTLVVSFAKIFPGRARPYEFLANGTMWHFLEGLKQAQYRSMPSAHAASAFMFSAFLARAYERGRRVFIAAAVLCATTRVLDQQHFVSDVVIGGAFGYWVGNGVFNWRWCRRLAELGPTAAE